MKKVVSNQGKVLGDLANVNHPLVQKKISKSLNLSIKEGAAASVFTGLSASYFSPFALFMNATSSQVGILHAIVNLLPSLVQIKSAKLVGKFSRKNLILFSVMSRILLMIPIILTGVLFYFGVPHMVWAFIFFAALYYVSTAIGYPSWFSLMGSLVDENSRGKYFSKRNRVIAFYGVISMIGGALILDLSKSRGIFYGNLIGYTLIGFGILFVIADIAKIISFILLTKHYEPKLKIRKKDYFSLSDFLKKGRNTPFGRFVLYRGLMSFGVAIASPFFAVYMLRELNLSYMWYIGIMVSATFFQFIFLPLLGKISDRYGNINVIHICSWAIFLVPGSWILASFISSPILIKLFLILIPSMMSGFGWAGYNLAVNNYVYDAVQSSKIGYAVSYMNLAVGVGVFFGAMVGSALAWLNVSFMEPILFIFAVSGVLRFLMIFFGKPMLQEVRHVRKFSSHYLLKELSPMQGFTREVYHPAEMFKEAIHFISPRDRKRFLEYNSQI